MATSTYLKISPIKGESNDVKHPDYIEVDSFGVSTSQIVSDASTTGGLVGSQALFGELSISKAVDTASPDISQYCAKGTTIAELELEVCVETGSKEWYVQIKCKNCVISNVSVGGGGLSRPTESVSIAYSEITYDYKPLGTDGNPGSAVGPKGFNVATGDPI